MLEKLKLLFNAASRMTLKDVTAFCPLYMSQGTLSKLGCEVLKTARWVSDETRNHAGALKLIFIFFYL